MKKYLKPLPGALSLLGTPPIIGRSAVLQNFADTPMIGHHTR